MAQRACTFTGAEYSANPAVTGQSVLITVELHDAVGGNDATWESVKSATWYDVRNMKWGD